MSKSKKFKQRDHPLLAESIDDDIEDKRINWFPGHMNKAIRKVKEKLRQVDIVLEIRDARSPLATANKSFTEAVGQKSRLIVLNKTNLANPDIVKSWETWFERQGVPFVFVNCFDKKSLDKIVLNAKKVVHTKRLQSNPDGTERKKFKMMIIGLPNTGKSTIINKLAKRNATRAADKPGLTQTQIWVKIDTELEILDTPGIMPPRIDKYEHGLWLAALHAIPDKIVKEEESACFVIEYLLKAKSETFKNFYKLESLDEGLVETLNFIAKIRGCIRKKGEYDYDRVYKMILIDFRSGDLGRHSFGIPPLPRVKL